MEFFPIQKDLQAFLLRSTASLERADGLMEETQRLIRHADQILERINALLDAFTAAVATDTRR